MSANLWTASGTRIAQATFANETSSGWQTVSIPPDRRRGRARPTSRRCTCPRATTPATPSTSATAATRPGRSGPWPTAKTAATASSATARRASPRRPPVPPTTGSTSSSTSRTTWRRPSSARSPAAGLQSVSRTSPVQATFSEGMNPSTLVFEVRTASGTLVPGTTSYDGATRTASFTPSGQLARPHPAHRDRRVRQGCLRRPAGRTARVDASPRSATPVPRPTSLWDTSATPAGFVQDTPFELGVRFRADVAGEITALRFYRPPGSTGAQPGHLWDAAGTLLSTVVFPASSQPGWQQANLACAGARAEGRHLRRVLPRSRRSLPGDRRRPQRPRRPGAAARAGVDPQAGNGVYRSGASGFPTSTFEASNYWADVVFRVPPDTRRPGGRQHRARRQPHRRRDRRAGAGDLRRSHRTRQPAVHAVRPGRHVGGRCRDLRRRDGHGLLHADERPGQRGDLHRLRSGDRHARATPWPSPPPGPSPRP